MLRASLGLLLMGAFGCASGGCSVGAYGAEAGGKDCQVELEPRQRAARPAAAPPVRTAPLSQIVVHAEAPLAPLQQRLEKEIPTRVAEGRVGIGPAGKVSYRAERGAVTVSVSRTR